MNVFELVCSIISSCVRNLLYFQPLPTSAPPTTPPLNVSALPWVETKNATLLRTKIKPDLLEPSARCNHVFGTYIVPGIMHFIAYIIGIYHFRIQDHEGLYVLMEKVSKQPSFNMYLANLPILSPLKTPEYQSFSLVTSGYKIGVLA